MAGKNISGRMRRNKKFALTVIIVAASALVLTSVLGYLELRSWVSPPRGSDPVAAEIAELEYRIAQLKDSLERNPDETYFLTQLGNAYYDLGRIYQYLNNEPKWNESFAAAIEPYGKVLATNPENVNVRVDRAVAAFWSGNHSLAEDEFERSIEIDPNHLNAHYNYGVFLFFGLKNPAEAIARFEKVLELSPTDPQLISAAELLIAQAKQELNNPVFDTTPQKNN